MGDYGDFNYRGYLRDSVLKEPESGFDFGSSKFTPAGSFLDAQNSSAVPKIDTGLNLNDYSFGPGSGLDFGSGSGSFTPAFSDKFWGYKDPKSGMMFDGYAKTGLGAIQSGLGFYLGKGQLDQAKSALNEDRRQFNLNYAAQKATINDQLRWQHKARTDRDPTYNGQMTQIV